MAAIAPARRPGRPRNEAIDTAVMNAAVDELIERGFVGLSMESIAARAGVAKTTIYRRWANTDDLALDAIRGFGIGDAEAPRPGPVREQLLDMLERMRRVWADPRYAALMRRAAADGTGQPEIYHGFRQRLIAPMIALMRTALEQGVEDGDIRPGLDLEWVRQAVVAPIMAAALTHKTRVTRAQLIFTVDTVLAGVHP